MEHCVNAERKTTMAVYCRQCGYWENLWTGEAGCDPILPIESFSTTTGGDLSRGEYGLAVTADVRLGDSRDTDNTEREGE